MIVLALVLTGLSAAAAEAAPWSPDDAPGFAAEDVAAFEALVADARALAPLTGLSVGVLHDGQVWRGAFGHASLAPVRPVTRTSSYRLASITKTFTALVALQLARDGALDLDADVRTYVPAYPAKPWPISPRQLLNHTSGIPHYRNIDDAMTRERLDTAGSLALFADRELAAPPGTLHLYSSFGYVLLGAAVESAAHASFGDVLQGRVLAPLGMTRTGLERSGLHGRDDVSGYRIVGGRVVASPRLDIASRFSSGGLRSTIDDLLRLANGLLVGNVVDAASWRAMTTPVVTTDGKQADYGLGIAVYPSRGHRVVAHAGGQPETSSLLFLVPQERLAVVLLTNVEGQGAALTRLAGGFVELLVDDGVPRRELYADDIVDEIVFDGMTRIFSHGLASPTLFAQRATAADVDAAFAALPGLFSRAGLATAPEAGRQALRDAYQPFAKRVSVLVGAEMAHVLRSRNVDLRALRRAGPQAFFAAYADACRRDCAHPLPPGLAADVERFHQAWRAVPDDVLGTRPERMLEAGDAALAPLRAMVGTPLHPSFVDDLERLAVRLRSGRQVPASRAALALSEQLHPRSPQVQLALVEADVLDGNLAAAEARLRVAWAMPARPLSFTRDALKRRPLPPAAVAAWRGLVDKLPPDAAAAPSVGSAARGVGAAAAR